MTSALAPVAPATRAGADRFAAGAVMFLLVVHVPGFSLVPVAIFPAIYLAIPFFFEARRIVRVLAGAAVVAIISGFVLSMVAPASGHEVSGASVWGPMLLWVASIPLLSAAAAWALQRIPVRVGILLMLGGGILSAAVASLEWKGTLGIFATAFVLILFNGRWFLSTLALLGLLVASATNDARSMAVASLAALIIQVLLREKDRPRGKVHRAVLFISGVATVGIVGVFLMASGAAGETVKLRTLDQLDKANPLYGVRAEWAATTSLFEGRPLGFGVDVHPSDAAVSAGINAVRAAGGDWTSHYFSGIVFGERVDLHSTLANLWFHFGIGGVAVAVIVGFILFRGVRDAADSAMLFGMGGIFLMLMGIWDLLFSPMADIGRVIAAIAVILALAADAAQRAQPSQDHLAGNSAPAYSTTRRALTPTKMARV